MRCSLCALIGALRVGCDQIGTSGPTTIATLHAVDTRFETNGAKYTGKDTKYDNFDIIMSDRFPVLSQLHRWMRVRVRAEWS